jgi:HEAT repeat protein
MDNLKTITVLAILLAVLVATASAETDAELNMKIDSLFVLASNPEAHHQHLVEPSREELAQLGERAVPRLVSKLSTEDARERHALADIFKKIGQPAVPALVEALDTDNLFRLRNTARCLGDIGDKSATPALLPLFTHENHTVRSTAVTAVGKSHDSSAVDNCITMLSDGAEPVRKSAAVALGRIADHRAVHRLIDALQDPHFSVRMSAVGSLITIGNPSCDSLISRYNDLSDVGGYLAFEVWAGCRYAPARKLLEKATHSEETFTRAFAILALAAVDVKKGRRRIEKMRNTETDLFVRSRINAAEELLDSISD